MTNVNTGATSPGGDGGGGENAVIISHASFRCDAATRRWQVRRRDAARAGATPRRGASRCGSRRAARLDGRASSLHSAGAWRCSSASRSPSATSIGSRCRSPRRDPAGDPADQYGLLAAEIGFSPPTRDVRRRRRAHRRLGTRRGFLVIMVAWSLACASHGLATASACWPSAGFCSAPAKAAGFPPPPRPSPSGFRRDARRPWASSTPALPSAPWWRRR